MARWWDDIDRRHHRLLRVPVADRRVGNTDQGRLPLLQAGVSLSTGAVDCVGLAHDVTTTRWARQTAFCRLDSYATLVGFNFRLK